jgi:DNA helicase-2/ATP-dependent DNA helicase PcrA
VTPKHLERLNPPQFEAVTTISGPLLVLAGAGSGKTRVLTHRIAHLLHEGVDPERVIAVTFTNKAATEMRERVAELVGPAGTKVWVSTFHSSCCRILRLEAEHLGYTRRFAIYDDDDQHRLIRQILTDLGYDLKLTTPHAILGKIDHYKNRLITVDQLVAEHRAHGNDPLVRAWRMYEENLAAADAMDFNDLIGKAVQLFEEHPDVLQRWRERFQYVLVDEYQDTNRAQYRLLRSLVAEHHNLAVVGDDDQSIYAFRGADIRNILDFQSDFPEAKIVRLEQNYRSTENILAVANAVVSLNPDRIEKRLWTETSGGNRVTFLLCDDARDEARKVAMGIQGLARRGTKLSDVAIIYRTNATSQPFEAALREARLPYQVVGGRQFYARREIRDALAYLRLVSNPAHDAAFLRVVNVPTRGVGNAALSKLRAEAANRGEPLLKAARAMARGSDRAAKAIGSFVEVIDALTELARTASLPALVQQLLDRSGYKAMLEAEASREAEGRLDNLQQLLRDAANFEPPEPTAAPDERLSAWLDAVALTGADQEIPDGGVVTMMTVHTSKGLEFPVVFVVNMIEGSFPHSRSAEEQGGVEEERRLAYVAFTRARKRLIVTRSRKQLQFDGGSANATAAAPSRFLFGIPADACEGDLPVDDEPEAAPEPRFVEDAQQRKIRALQQMAARPSPARPPPRAPVPRTTWTTIEVEHSSQLKPGVRVFHRVHGEGVIEKTSSLTASVRFMQGTRSVPIVGRELALLRED